MKNSSQTQTLALSQHENVIINRIKIYLAIAVIYIAFLTAIIL